MIKANNARRTQVSEDDKEGHWRFTGVPTVDVRRGRIDLAKQRELRITPQALSRDSSKEADAWEEAEARIQGEGQ